MTSGTPGTSQKQIDSGLLEKFQDLDRLWTPANPAGSEAALRALLPEAQGLTGQDRGYLIELCSLIARSEAAQGKLTEARSSIDQAIALLQTLEASDSSPAKIRCLIEKGRIHILEKTPSQARGYFSEAWNLATQAEKDHFTVEIAQLMAETEPQKSQQEWLLRAIAIAEKSSLPRSKSWLGSLYISLGWKYYELKQFDKSLESFRAALEHLKTHSAPREAFLAQWAIGKVLRIQGKTEEALSIQEALLAGLGIGGPRDGRLYEELAECLQTLKRTAEAQSYFELAYRELSEDTWIKDNQPVHLKRMKDLGKVK